MKWYKRLNMATSIVVFVFHFYLGKCTNCSTIFVWWKSIGSIDLDFTPITFAGLIAVRLLLPLFGIGRGATTTKVINVLVGALALANLLYWLQVLYFLGPSFYEYIIFSVVHGVLIGLISRDLLGHVLSP